MWFCLWMDDIFSRLDCARCFRQRISKTFVIVKQSLFFSSFHKNCTCLCIKVNNLISDWRSSTKRNSEDALKPDGAWIALISAGQNGVESVVDEFFNVFSIDQLLGAKDKQGRPVMQAASPNIQKMISTRSVFFNGL